ncbi:MAG: ribonuclease III [Bacteroidetes bacterium]|nr:ribonuclease III [Bacteroidota bacterium]MBL0015173.1 ribonuclease III [Bacteroidota bacterium]
MITGFTPNDPFLYHLALRHSSLVTTRKFSHQECNERLEFLGDTVLDAVVSEYLFKLYPTQDEGFLTEMRAKIVNRGSLNEICKKIKLDSLIQFNKTRKGQVNKSMFGDALEAFIGAVYMDLGYIKTKKFIIGKILHDHVDLGEMEDTIYNFKSMLLEHVQKEKLENLTYELVAEKGEGNDKFFKIDVKIGEKVIGTGVGKKKKVAEQNASQDALIKLKVLTQEMVQQL